MPPPHHARQHQPHSRTPCDIVADALRNPYAPSSNQFHNPYSAHYANAVMQSQLVARTTPEGYTLSSMYHPTQARGSVRIGGLQPPSSTRGLDQGHKPASSMSARQPTQHSGSWYQPGSSRCTYQKCSFSGSHKSVEIHMMDRHLIYPPNWAKKQKGSDWDGDPCLKGCIYECICLCQDGTD